MLEVIAQNTTGQAYDLSALVTSLSFTDNINKSGIVNCSYLQNESVTLDEGGIIRITYDGEVYFLGYIFKLSFSESTEIKLTAYDALRYLKTNETYVFEGIAASAALRQICAEFGLNTGEIEDTQFLLPKLIFDDKDILDIISDLLKLTLRSTQQLYILKCIAGSITLKNITSMVTDFVVDPDSNLLEYSYDRSIDEDTYNQIKLVRDNKDTGQRELFISRDSSAIQKWGLLQYYEKVDDSLNTEQIKQRADGLLSLKNRIVRTLTNVKVFGDERLRAGHMIFINLPKQDVYGYLLCTKAAHSFENDAHTVSADFRLI